jgi:hypothetical protein
MLELFQLNRILFLLIKSGGGTGPMKPGNRQYILERCQFLQNDFVLRDEEVLRVWVYNPLSLIGKAVFV